MTSDLRPRTSGLAILSLASSVVFCLPLGVILGLAALVRIQRAEGKLGGRGLAVAAVALSAALNLTTYAFMSEVYPALMENSECYAQQLLLGRELTRVQQKQAAFRQDQGRYGTLEEIGFQPSSPADPYQYEAVEASEKTYRVRARAPELGGDTWELDQSGMPKNVVFGCAP